MAENPIKTPLPADLPEDWTGGQTVAPTGAEVGLSEQHGYNYLMEQVNAVQTAAKEIGEAFSGLATLGPDGKVPVSELPKLDYDPAGSAAAVQQALTAHTGNKNNPHAVTAEQVGALASSGGVMSGALSMSGHKIANLAAPTDLTDAANKQYVDEQVGSSRVVTGTYIGDGAPSQTIQLGFTPKAVLVCQNGILSRGYQNHYAEGLALDGYPAAASNSNVVSVVEGGFQVFDGTSANHNGRTNVASQKYYYLTWK